MGHTPTIIDGKECPSVTEITGLLDKSHYLVPWAAKHGVKKAKALQDAWLDGLKWLGETAKINIELAGQEKIVDRIPDSWFEKNNLKREDFWKGPDDITKEAKERGLKFHELVEIALKIKFGLPVDGTIPIETLKAAANDEHVMAIERWCDRVGFVPTDFEKKVISKKYLYGGTFDCLGKIEPRLILPDWKRTNQISGPTYSLQLSGYAGAHYEETGRWIDEGRIIRPYELKNAAKEDSCKETADGFKWSFKGSRIYIEERRYHGLRHYFEIFLKLRDVWDFVNARGMWEQ